MREDQCWAGKHVPRTDASQPSSSQDYGTKGEPVLASKAWLAGPRRIQSTCQTLAGSQCPTSGEQCGQRGRRGNVSQVPSLLLLLFSFCFYGFMTPSTKRKHLEILLGVMKSWKLKEKNK